MNSPATTPSAGLFQLQVRAGEAFAQSGELEAMTRTWAQALKAAPSDGGLFHARERFKLLMCLRRYGSAFALAERILDRDRSPRTIEELKSPWNSVLFSRPELRERLEEDRLLLRARCGRGPSPWAPFYLSQLTPEENPEFAVRLREVARTAKQARYRWMRREVGQLALREFKYDAGLREFRASAQATTPRAWRSFALAGETLIFLGRGDAALAEFLKAVAAAPDAEKGEALAWMGESCLWLGRYEDALVLLDQAVAQNGLYAYCWRGAAKFKLGRAQDALLDFDLGLKLLPRDREAYLWRGEVKSALGDYDGALDDLSKTPMQGVASSRWMWHDVNRSLVYAKLGRHDAMRGDFEALRRPVVEYLLRRLGFARGHVPRDGDIPRILAAALNWAKGYRRSDDHGQCAWMGAAGRRGPAGWVRYKELTMRAPGYDS